MKRDAVLVDEETGATVLISEGSGTVTVSIVDFRDLGVAISVTLRKGTAVENFRGVLSSLSEAQNTYVDLLDRWLARR
ncbi:MAG TPA: hypothetical protein VGP72_00455 [Planctomycetota bacterium]|jgi:hypothetical protein